MFYETIFLLLIPICVENSPSYWSFGKKQIGSNQSCQTEGQIYPSENYNAFYKCKINGTDLWPEKTICKDNELFNSKYEKCLKPGDAIVASIFPGSMCLKNSSSIINHPNNRPGNYLSCFGELLMEVYCDYNTYIDNVTQNCYKIKTEIERNDCDLKEFTVGECQYHYHKPEYFGDSCGDCKHICKESDDKTFALEIICNNEIPLTSTTEIIVTDTLPVTTKSPVTITEVSEKGIEEKTEKVKTTEEVTSTLPENRTTTITVPVTITQDKSEISLTTVSVKEANTTTYEAIASTTVPVTITEVPQFTHNETPTTILLGTTIEDVSEVQSTTISNKVTEEPLENTIAAIETTMATDTTGDISEDPAMRGKEEVTKSYETTVTKDTTKLPSTTALMKDTLPENATTAVTTTESIPEVPLTTVSRESKATLPREDFETPTTVESVTRTENPIEIDLTTISEVTSQVTTKLESKLALTTVSVKDNKEVSLPQDFTTTREPFTENTSEVSLTTVPLPQNRTTTQATTSTSTEIATTPVASTVSDVLGLFTVTSNPITSGLNLTGTPPTELIEKPGLNHQVNVVRVISPNSMQTDITWTAFLPKAGGHGRRKITMHDSQYRGIHIEDLE